MLRSAVLVLVVIVFLGISVDLRAESPRDCVVRAGEALDRADAALFADNVDMDEVIHTGLEVFLAESKKPDVARELPPMLNLMLSQVSDPERGETLRVLLARETKAFVLGSIASGAFSGKKTAKGNSQGLFGPLFANASMGRKELIQIGTAEVLHDGWRVPCTLLDYGNGIEYPLDAKVQARNGQLMVTQILNLPELFARIREEARQLEE